MEMNIPVLMQFAYCVFVVSTVTIGALLGLFISFCLFGYFCMSRNDTKMIKRHWLNVWKGRVK